MKLFRAIFTKINTFFALIKVKSHGKKINVNKRSRFTSKTVLANNCNFNGIKIFGEGNVVIGNNFHSGSNCVILTTNHNYEGTRIPYDSTYISKDVIIEDNVWIGYGVTILGGAHIEEGAIIQAGAVVVGRIEKCGIAGGNPAKIFKYRDIDHYEKLKEKELFF